jgi:hypothetical protein
LTNKQKPAKIFFLLIVLYSFGGLIQIDNDGGPCNSGLIIFMLGPVLLLIAFVQYLFMKKLFAGRKISTGGKILSTGCCLFWGFWTVGFFVDDPRDATLYLLPFLLLNIAVTIKIFLRKKSC